MGQIKKKSNIEESVLMEETLMNNEPPQKKLYNPKIIKISLNSMTPINNNNKLSKKLLFGHN